MSNFGNEFSSDLNEHAIAKTPASLFGNESNEFWLWANTEGRDKFPKLRKYLPDLPSEEFQLRVTAHAGTQGLKVGFKIYQTFRDQYLKEGGQFQTDTTALDFGCGWGRITRFFLKDIQPENLFGIDINAEAIEACKETNQWSNFFENRIQPPTNFKSAQFDFIFANSVFSHLPEDLHLSWVKEIRRILKPNGILVATTLGRDFLDQCSVWGKKDQSGLPVWQRSAVSAYSDTQGFLDKYDKGNFCFGLANANQPHYGYACIPQKYVLKFWGDYFNSIKYLSDRKLHAHNLIIAINK